MSKSTPPTHIASLPDQFRAAVTLHPDKPDFRELDFASPLHTPPITDPSTSTSTSSSSSGNHSVSSHRHHARPRSDFGQSVNSPPAPATLLPAGNICPKGKPPKTSTTMKTKSEARTRRAVLGTGSGHYGHGSIMRGTGNVNCVNVASKSGGFDGSRDAEEVKRIGNEMYKRGNFAEALRLYDRAIELSPGNAAYRSNRAAALSGLGRSGEAVRECEEAVKLDPGYSRAHQRLGSLFIR